MEFMNNEHKVFYNRMVTKTHSEQDPYRKALFYTLGLTDETRRNINNLYDFKENGINPDGMHGGWQTNTSWNVTLLAFNLYNGYSGETEAERQCTPYDLFSSSLMEYMFQAVRLLYPCYAKGGALNEC